MEKIKITNPTQFQKLVEELEKNPTLATGFRRGTVPVDFKGQWEGIATILNALGPPIRTGDGWQKIWRDLKFKVKKKMVFNKAECTATGGGTFKQIILSPLEEAVSNLLQFEKQINPEGVFLGAPNPDIEEEEAAANSSRQKSTTTISSATAPSTTITISSAETTPSATSAETTSSAIDSAQTTPSTIKNVLKRKISPTQKKTEVVDRYKLLEAHSKDQARLLAGISNSMSSMKRTLKDLKDIQQKRLMLEVERSGREKELHENVIKIKKIEYLIKERELQALNAQTLNYN